MAALDLAMDANPVGVLALAILAAVAAVALLIAGIVAIVDHWDEIVTSVEEGAAKIEKAFDKLDKALPPWLRKVIDAGAAGLKIQFPAVGELGAFVDSLAHAKRPPVQKPDPKAAPGVPPPGLPFNPASFKGPWSRPAPASAASHMGATLGTIVIQADPGTKVVKMQSSGLVEKRYNRGRVVG